NLTLIELRYYMHRAQRHLFVLELEIDNRASPTGASIDVKQTGLAPSEDVSFVVEDHPPPGILLLIPAPAPVLILHWNCRGLCSTPFFLHLLLLSSPSICIFFLFLLSSSSFATLHSSSQAPKRSRAQFASLKKNEAPNHMFVYRFSSFLFSSLHFIPPFFS